VAAELLLDTGALVSLLDRSQPRHAECVAFFRSWRGGVVSTEAVLTEATHLLAHVPGGREACVRFFLEGGATLVPSDDASLRACLALVSRYADLPLEFADATLVVLAAELGTDLVFTLDADFDAVRLPDGTPLRRAPA
jgi:hypothetical protein